MLSKRASADMLKTRVQVVSRDSFESKGQKS